MFILMYRVCDGGFEHLKPRSCLTYVRIRRLMTNCFFGEVDRLLCNAISLLCNVISLLCEDQGKSTINDRCNESQNSYNRIANTDAKFGEEMLPSRLNRWRMRWW